MDHNHSQIAVCLAGGGSYGITQSGALAYLAELIEKKHLKKCHIISSSVGTLNGTQFHAGDIEKMLHLWRTIRTRDVYKDRGVVDLAMSLGRGFLHDSSPLRRYLADNIDYPALMKAEGEFWINATDLTNDRPYTREVGTLNPEDLVTMALASASPPIYFPTVKFDGLELCDSGVVNNFGIVQAINMGCKTIIVLLPSKPAVSKRHKNLFQLLGKVLGLSMNSYLERESKSVLKINEEIDAYSLLVDKYNELAPDSLDISDRPRKIKLIMVYPEANRSFDFLDFDFKGIDREEILKHGYERCKAILDKELS